MHYYNIIICGRLQARCDSSTFDHSELAILSSQENSSHDVVIYVIVVVIFVVVANTYHVWDYVQTVF